MTYLDQSEIGSNGSMLARVAQCAAQQGEPDPDGWAHTHRREWAAAPGWENAWASAKAGHEDDPAYDPGADGSVITDGQILSQVQSMLDPPTREPPNIATPFDG
jgi:hypothetical protein